MYPTQCVDYRFASLLPHRRCGGHLPQRGGRQLGGLILRCYRLSPIIILFSCIPAQRLYCLPLGGGAATAAVGERASKAVINPLPRPLFLHSALSFLISSRSTASSASGADSPPTAAPPQGATRQHKHRTCRIACPHLRRQFGRSSTRRCI